MLNHLESLCRLCGASGQEHPVRDYLIEQIKPLGIPYQIDPLGNLIVEKKGKQTPPKKWMIGAHMDEVGLDRKSTRLNSSHNNQSRMPSSA